MVVVCEIAYAELTMYKPAHLHVHTQSIILHTDN